MIDFKVRKHPKDPKTERRLRVSPRSTSDSPEPAPTLMLTKPGQLRSPGLLISSLLAEINEMLLTTCFLQADRIIVTVKCANVCESTLKTGNVGVSHYFSLVSP